jgi:hypothetical protein
MSTTTQKSRGARVAARAVRLREQQPSVPAMRILDQVFMRHRGKCIEFDDPDVPGGDCLVEPIGNPFAALLIEALDPTSSAAQWSAEAARVAGDLGAEILVRDRWTVLVVAPFLQRYELDL